MNENNDWNLKWTIIGVMVAIIGISWTAYSYGISVGKEMTNDENGALKIENKLKDEKINELSNKNSELSDVVKSQRSYISKLEKDLNKQTNAVRDSVSKQQYENVANQVRNSVSIQDYDNLKADFQKTQESLKNSVSATQYNKVFYEKQELEKILKAKRDCRNELNENKKQLVNINQQLLKHNCGNDIYGNCISESQRDEFNKQRIAYEKYVSDLNNRCFG